MILHSQLFVSWLNIGSDLSNSASLVSEVWRKYLQILWFIWEILGTLVRKDRIKHRLNNYLTCWHGISKEGRMWLQREFRNKTLNYVAALKIHFLMYWCAIYKSGWTELWGNSTDVQKLYLIIFISHFVILLGFHSHCIANIYWHSMNKQNDIIKNARTKVIRELSA